MEDAVKPVVKDAWIKYIMKIIFLMSSVIASGNDIHDKVNLFDPMHVFWATLSSVFQCSFNAQCSILLQIEHSGAVGYKYMILLLLLLKFLHKHKHDNSNNTSG